MGPPSSDGARKEQMHTAHTRMVDVQSLNSNRSDQSCRFKPSLGTKSLSHPILSHTIPPPLPRSRPRPKITHATKCPQKGTWIFTLPLNSYHSRGGIKAQQQKRKYPNEDTKKRRRRKKKKIRGKGESIHSPKGGGGERTKPPWVLNPCKPDRPAAGSTKCRNHLVHHGPLCVFVYVLVCFVLSS